MKQFISYCLKQSLFFNLLAVFIAIYGLVVVFTTQREAFPLVVMDIMTISTTYPGSSPQEIEKLITTPIERALKEVDGIDKINSISIEGRSTVIVKIDEDLSKANKEKAKTDIQRAVDRMEDLPNDAQKPLVNEVKTHHLPTIEINLSGLPELELQKYADILKEYVESIQGVSSVVKKGWRDREFWVEADPILLKDLHLSLAQVVTSLQAQNVNLPAGTLKYPGEEYLIRTLGEVNTPRQILNVVVRTNDLGNATKIQDIATVKDTFSDEIRIEKVRGQRAVTLVVLKREKGDSIVIVEAVKKTIESFKQISPKGLNIETANDMSYYVKRRLNVLISNGWFGIMLVMGSLLFFLSRQIAVITALGIPFAFFMTFIMMKFFGISINMISMFGLIIVSGMLVDDSIVFAENIYSHMQTKKEPREAALIGSTEVVIPVIGTVLTTILAFLPLSFMSGIMGKFVWQISAVVIIALLASLFEAIFILPSHCADWINLNTIQIHNPNWFEKLRETYLKYLGKALNVKYPVLIGTGIAFMISLIIGTQVIPFVLFPSKGIELFFIRAHTKIGTPLHETSHKMKALEDLVSTLPSKELDTFTTTIGISQQDVNDPFTKRGSHVAQIAVFLTPESKRKRDADEIVRDLQKQAASIQGFKFIRFDKVKPGPPIGKPISIEIRGDEFSTLKAISEDIKTQLHRYKGVSEIEDSHEIGKQEFQMMVNEQRAAQARLSVSQIAGTLRNAFEGVVATTIKKTDEEINIRVRVAEPYRNDPRIFDLLLIPNDIGNLIPLKEVTQIKRGRGMSHIDHYDHKRTITVTATIDPKETTSVNVNKSLQRKFKDISQKYIGYNVRYGGEQEDTTHSLRSLGRAFIIALIGNFFILCVIFRSLLQPFIIMITLPLSVIGIVFAFFIHGYPFSFMALLGMIGLSGVVVNNAIILIDLMNNYRSKMSNIKEVVLKACDQRLRPIILTSGTTILGLGPVAYGIGGSDDILKPAALALSWGLLFSTFLTLFVVPCLYLIFKDVSHYVPITAKNLASKIRKNNSIS